MSLSVIAKEEYLIAEAVRVLNERIQSGESGYSIKRLQKRSSVTSAFVEILGTAAVVPHAVYSALNLHKVDYLSGHGRAHSSILWEKEYNKLSCRSACYLLYGAPKTRNYEVEIRVEEVEAEN